MAKHNIIDSHTYNSTHILKLYPLLSYNDTYIFDVLIRWSVYRVRAYRGSPGEICLIYINAPNEYTAYIFLLDMGYYDILIVNSIN